MTRTRLIVAMAIVILVGSVSYALQSRDVAYISSGRLARVYGDLQELSNDSTLIVLGSFSERTRVIDTPWHQESPVKICLHEFVPSKVFKGETTTPVWVAVYGTKQNGKWIGAVSQALYTQGSSYILFLTESVNGPFHFTTGSYQGSFRVKDGKVWARSELGESDMSAVKGNGQNLEAFLGLLPTTKGK